MLKAGSPVRKFVPASVNPSGVDAIPGTPYLLIRQISPLGLRTEHATELPSGVCFWLSIGEATSDEYSANVNLTAPVSQRRAMAWRGLIAE